MSRPLVSFLILDFRKPKETKTCLESIKRYVQFPHKIIYLDNGSREGYPQEFKNSGLCDIIIQNNTNTGCGNGIDQLFKICDTKYGVLVQNDQYLGYELTESHVNYFIDLIDKQNFGYVDLAGAQAGNQVYSERAGLINRDFYLSIYRGEDGKLGGPGPYNDNKYSEQYVQEYFKQNNLQIAHISPPPFVDNGRYSIRELPCGGILIHRCDTKHLWVIKPIKQRYIHYPVLTDSEYFDMVNGKWPIWGIDEIGRIPEAWAAHSFQCWS